MAHLITKSDKMVYYGEAPWHIRETGDRCWALSDAERYNLPLVLERAGLLYRVEQFPVQSILGENPPAGSEKLESPILVPNYFARRRMDTGAPLGIVGPVNTILQNETFAERAIAPFVAPGTAAIETAFTMEGGAKVCILLRLEVPPIGIGDGDEVLPFLAATHSHDGSWAIRLGFTLVRMVCHNTCRLAHHEESSRFLRIRHTESAEANIEQVTRIMNLATQTFEATAEQYRALARTAINGEDLKRYVRTVFEVPVDDAAYEEEVSTRRKNQLLRVEELYLAGPGADLPTARGTLWGAYNAVTGYLTHEAGNGEESRLLSNLNGKGKSTNDRALEVALAMAR